MSEDQREEDKRQRRKNSAARQTIKEIYSKRNSLSSAGRRAISSLYSRTKNVFSSNVKADTRKLDKELKRSEIGRAVGQMENSTPTKTRRAVSGFLGKLTKDALKGFGTIAKNAVLSVPKRFTPKGMLVSAVAYAFRVDGLNKNEELELARESARIAKKERDRATRELWSERGRNGGYDPRGPQFSSLDIRDSGSFPIIFDLDRSGSFDLVSDDQGGWAGPSDGFLVIDADGSGAIDRENEIAFTEWDEHARTDLEGLALAFDSNGDGRFDGGDERFAEFSVWQDANGDRVSQADELRSLEEAGINSIDLSGVPYAGDPAVIQEKAGNQVFGVTTVAYDDGSFGIAGDVALAGGGAAEGSDGEMDGDMTSVADRQTDAASSDNHPLAAQIAALTSRVDQLTSEIAALKPEPAGCSGYSGTQRQKVDQSQIYAANSQAA